MSNPSRPERPTELPFTNCIPELCLFYEDICGCAQGHSLEGDQVIHWRGKHWRLECAFKQAISELNFLKKEILFAADFKLSHRAKQFLSDKDVRTVADLLKLKEVNILWHPKVGRKTTDEIIRYQNALRNELNSLSNGDPAPADDERDERNREDDER